MVSSSFTTWSGEGSEKGKVFHQLMPPEQAFPIRDDKDGDVAVFFITAAEGRFSDVVRHSIRVSPSIPSSGNERLFNISVRTAILPMYCSTVRVAALRILVYKIDSPICSLPKGAPGISYIAVRRRLVSRTHPPGCWVDRVSRRASEGIIFAPDAAPGTPTKCGKGVLERQPNHRTPGNGSGYDTNAHLRAGKESEAYTRNDLSDSLEVPAEPKCCLVGLPASLLWSMRCNVIGITVVSVLYVVCLYRNFWCFEKILAKFEPRCPTLAPMNEGSTILA